MCRGCFGGKPKSSMPYAVGTLNESIIVSTDALLRRILAYDENNHAEIPPFSVIRCKFADWQPLQPP